MPVPTTTRAIQLHELGGPEVLRLDAVELPTALAPTELLIRQTAVGLNFIDTYHRRGVYPLPSLPHGLGMEAAGVVLATGEGVDAFAPGDRVAYAGGPPGAYREHRVMPQALVVPVPDHLDDRRAAAALLKGMTVEYLILRTFKVAPGMTVLWHAAAGGLGLIACQWLKHLGATVIGTVGSEAKAALAAEHGCDHPIVYTREDFVARVRELTGGAGVPVVYDSVGRATYEGSLDCLAPRGMLVASGNASGTIPPVDPLELTRRGSLYMTRPSLMHYVATAAELRASARALFDVLERGAVSVDPRPDQIWPLDQASAAHRALEGRATTGSCLLIP
ncbi:MAG: quinone oxidoreductase [Myxococcales bacterium]|nr:quinone oxidoreductase [Myxococcales bacterium]